VIGRVPAACVSLADVVGRYHGPLSWPMSWAGVIHALADAASEAIKAATRNCVVNVTQIALGVSSGVVQPQRTFLKDL